jgi:DNA-directed RNA polymerase
MALGSERFRKRLAQATDKGRGSTAGAAKRLVAAAIDPLEKGIAHFVEEASGKRGGQHIAVKWLLRIGDDRARVEIARKELKRRMAPARKVELIAQRRAEGFAIAAYMTAKCVFDSLARHHSVYTMSREIAELILDELKYRRFKEQAPGLFDYRMDRFHTSSYSHMARSLGAAMKFAEIDVTDLEMTKAHKVHVGAKLIDLFAQTTGLIELRSERIIEGRGRRKKIRHDLSVHATPETLEWMQKRNDALEFLQPVSLPMIVPPMQWEKGQRGGYRFALRDKFTLVRRVSKDHAETLDKAHMPLVYQALNAIQNTAWRINERVLKVVETLVERQSEISTAVEKVAGIPSLAPYPEPERPHDIDTNEEARTEWRFKKGRIDSKNVQRAGEALAFSKILATADAMRSEEAIFFPYNLDFRGRIYPVSNFLTPQGDDVCKGLLTFAQGKPIGAEGAAWLAVHGANCMDSTPQGEKVSKMTLQERVDWIFNHSEDLCLIAADPLGNRWWMDVEEPLQFLAFCFEWEQYRIHGSSYVCSLPISQDGTCNGLQHFSAMFRDEVGAAAVNLIPQDRPQDVYSLVAEDVKTALEQDIVNGGEEAPRRRSVAVVGARGPQGDQTPHDDLRVRIEAVRIPRADRRAAPQSR